MTCSVHSLQHHVAEVHLRRRIFQSPRPGQLPACKRYRETMWHDPLPYCITCGTKRGWGLTLSFCSWLAATSSASQKASSSRWSSGRRSARRVSSRDWSLKGSQPYLELLLLVGGGQQRVAEGQQLALHLRAPLREAGKDEALHLRLGAAREGLRFGISRLLLCLR